MGLASQISEREDAVLCSDVRNNLFGPMEFSRRDLAALNIMRGRDNGLADYNMVRKCHGLERIKEFGEINPYLNATNPEVFETLAELYGGDVDDIDVYVGGMLETVDGPGPLFSNIIVEQFERLRDADRFWFENDELGYVLAAIHQFDAPLFCRHPVCMYIFVPAYLILSVRLSVRHMCATCYFPAKYRFSGETKWEESHFFLHNASCFPPPRQMFIAQS